MLEPLSPNHIPEKIPEEKEDQHVEAAKAARSSADGGGSRFNFFRRSKKRKQSSRNGESDASSVYNEEEAVNLQLSPEAIEKLKRQRELKKNKNNQDGS